MFQPIVYWGPATAPACIDKNVWNWQNMTSKRHDQVASLRLRSMRSSRWQFRSIWRVLFFWLRMAKESTAREIGSLAYFSTEGIKWNYSKLFEPHTCSISTFCKISPHLNHFPSLLLAFDRSTPCHLPPLLDIDATPRLGIFFQLSQDLIVIDQEAASLLGRKWGKRQVR